MDSHKEVVTIDDSGMDTNWRDNNNIGVQYAKNRPIILDTLAEFSIVIHGIGFTLRPLHDHRKHEERATNDSAGMTSKTSMK